ncbi:MAG: triose-phosphate isomerase [bacterium]|nr:triose-phosphate isomerase [bacterium]
MKKLTIVANWKSNMTSGEAIQWLQEFPISQIQSHTSSKEIVICPPFTLLNQLKWYVTEKKLPFQIGSQDVSPFPRGAYTGEVAADLLKEFVTYSIIGHSERRKYFHEDGQMLANKVDLAHSSDLTVIFCVQGANTSIPKGVRVVAYEPVFAIGTGEPDSPENAESVARSISDNTQVEMVLYGGSVTEKNVSSFTKMEHIRGVLVGTASLNPSSFAQIIANA